MASVVPGGPPAIAPERAALLGVGPFGRRVTGLMARTAGGMALPTDSTPDSAFAGAPSAVVLALWRPAPALCERADVLSHETGIPWLPVVLEPAALRVGPLVVPGAGPCHRCFDERRLQHDPHPRTAAALFAAYDRDPACGPRGYLPQQARTGAGLAATVLQHPDGRPGQVLSVPSHGLAVRQDPVLACHGCRRCGLPTPRGDLSTLLRLKVHPTRSHHPSQDPTNREAAGAR